MSIQVLHVYLASLSCHMDGAMDGRVGFWGSRIYRSGWSRSTETAVVPTKMTSIGLQLTHYIRSHNTMRVSQFLTAALLPFIALAAKKSSEERFNNAHAKGQPMKVDDLSYDALTATPRDYSVAVLLTAMDARFGCQMCHEFQPEWELLAKSWTKGDKGAASRMLFATLDFLDGKQTFQSVRTHWRQIGEREMY